LCFVKDFERITVTQNTDALQKMAAMDGDDDASDSDSSDDGLGMLTESEKEMLVRVIFCFHTELIWNSCVY
jgi:hypothetical protein